MPKLIWMNSPTNHSGTVNFLFLDPDGKVDSFRLDVADGGGPYILGGPALFDSPEELTEAGLKLVDLMPAGFHFFPEDIDENIREAIVENKTKINNDSNLVSEEDWNLLVFSSKYQTVECCEMLLENQTPKTAIVFVDNEQEGNVLLAEILTKIYYGLSKKQRKALGLESDWCHSFDL